MVLKIHCFMDEEAAKTHLPKMKAVINKQVSYKKSDWMYNLARMTDKVQENMEDLMVEGNREVELTLDGLELWLKATLGKCTKKRPADGGLTEEQVGAQLLGDAVVDMLYTALTTCILFSMGFAWVEEDRAKVEDRLDVLADSESDSADTEMNRLEEVKEVMDLIHEAMENAGTVAEDLLKGILNGDVEAILNALADGTFQLDIGTADEP
jgi:hypothetical protein